MSDQTQTQALQHRTGGLQAPQLDYILLDGSSSMRDKWWDTLAALDGYMDTLRQQGVASHGILSVFDTNNLASIVRDSPIADWPSFSKAAIGSTWGATPLFDAINTMGRHLRDLNPARCTIVIITDGEETSSKFTSPVQARAILDWCRAHGWQVVFLGADFNNNEQAKLLGADESNSIGVRKQLMLEAGKALGAKRVSNARYGTDINFSKDEKENFGGYLTGPSNG